MFCLGEDWQSISFYRLKIYLRLKLFTIYRYHNCFVYTLDYLKLYELVKDMEKYVYFIHCISQLFISEGQILEEITWVVLVVVYVQFKGNI